MNIYIEIYNIFGFGNKNVAFKILQGYFSFELFLTKKNLRIFLQIIN